MSNQATIDALRLARLSGEKLKAYPGPAPRDMAEAFVIQSAVRASIGWTHKGWKIGCTSQRAQIALNTDGPFPGPVYAEWLFASGSHVPTLPSNSRTTEPEIAFTMASGLGKRNEPWTVAEVLGAVASVHASIEIVNPRLPKGFADVVEWYVADGGLSHALVLGPGVKPLAEGHYAKITNRVSVNGKAKSTGLELRGKSTTSPFGVNANTRCEKMSLRSVVSKSVSSISPSSSRSNHSGTDGAP